MLTGFHGPALQLPHNSAKALPVVVSRTAQPRTIALRPNISFAGGGRETVNLPRWTVFGPFSVRAPRVAPGGSFSSNQSYAAPIVGSHNRHRVASAFRIEPIALRQFCLGGVSEVPRYYFHVKSRQLTVLDQEGVELADIANAVKEAARRAQEIVLKDVLQGVSAVAG